MPPLRDAEDRFVSLWGQMAANWGISRSMAEVHALLYIVGRPLNTDDIMQRLSISRGNASMTLRSLADWGIVSRVRIRGERKEHYQAEQDVWKLFRTIFLERKKREVDPLLESLSALRDLTGEDSGESAGQIEAYRGRIDQMLGTIQVIDAIGRGLLAQPTEELKAAAEERRDDV